MTNSKIEAAILHLLWIPRTVLRAATRLETICVCVWLANCLDVIGLGKLGFAKAGQQYWHNLTAK